MQKEAQHFQWIPIAINSKLVVSTHLKKYAQIGSFPPKYRGEHKKSLSCHHPRNLPFALGWSSTEVVGLVSFFVVFWQPFRIGAYTLQWPTFESHLHPLRASTWPALLGKKQMNHTTEVKHRDVLYRFLGNCGWVLGIKLMDNSNLFSR